MEHNCATCGNAIFCPTWGEYKCMAYLTRNPYAPEEPNDCEKYEKKKSTTEPVCHCEDCLSQAREDIS